MSNDHDTQIPIPEMVFIEGETYMMGSQEYDDEQPIHEVKVPSFYLAKYPVTNIQFLPFLEANGNQEEGDFSWVDLEEGYEGVRCGIYQEDGQFFCVEGLENHPMVYVSWYGARAYCNWLSNETGHKYRLPSEAEWEYAARGGIHQSPFAFSGSNRLKESAWYTENSYRMTRPVGLKYPNELGVFDMSGTVWEWCADTWHGNYAGAPNWQLNIVEYVFASWHGNYAGAPKDGSSWEKDGDQDTRVIRGGSWLSDDSGSRVSIRHRNYAFLSSKVVGFRLAQH